MKPFYILALMELSMSDVQAIAKTGKSADVISKRIWDEIAKNYFRPISLSELAEVVCEVILRDQLSVEDAVYNWADERDENGFDIAELTTSSQTCRWGIIVDNLLPRQPGWSSVTAFSFFYEQTSFAEVLASAKLFQEAYHAEVRIYSLPLDFSPNEASRYTFGEMGIHIATIPYADASDDDHWLTTGATLEE